MEDQSDKNKSLDISKLSFDNIKKANQTKQCLSKDLQPLLEYSSWHFFESVVGKFIKGCKDSIHFLEQSIGAFHVLVPVDFLKDEKLLMLSKSIATTEFVENIKKRSLRAKTLKESPLKPLCERLVYKRKYSKYSKD